jgi:hypothetical protein
MPWVAQVDELIRGGHSSSDIAEYIQGHLMAFLDVKKRTLQDVVSRRKRKILEDEDDSGPENLSQDEPPLKNADDHGGPRVPRRMGQMASKMYRRAVGGINAIIEAEAAILMLRDRIDERVRIEADTGNVDEDLHKDIDAYRKLLLAHTELRKALGLIGTTQDSIKVSLDVQGIGEGFGKGVAQAVANPQSRAKLLAIAKRLLGSTADDGQVEP